MTDALKRSFRPKPAAAAGEAAEESETVEALKAERDDLRRKLARKDEVIAALSGELVGHRSAAGGLLDIGYRARRKAGQSSAGGRYIGSPLADAAGRRVAIDVMAIQFGVSGGVEVYMRTLVRSVLALEPERPATGFVLLCLDAQLARLQELFGDRVGYYVFKSRAAMRAAGALAGYLRRSRVVETIDRVPASFSRLREELGIDLLHCPVQCFSVFDFNVPAILHLHDLQHLHFPENFSRGDIDARNRLYGLSADLSAAIVATSDYVRDDIVARMGVPAAKVACIPATWDPAVEAGIAVFTPEQADSLYRLPPVFGLFPAQFWPHKNHARLVEALAIVHQKLPALDFKLVFTGNRAHAGWPKVAETIARLGLADSVLCLDYVPVENLAALYRRAAFCVMPSTFEASSYPVIEAQLLGCPAMCSNVTSLPELVRGGAGLLFDPFEPEDIADKMLYWLRRPDEAAGSAARAREKVRCEHGQAAYAGAIAGLYRRLAPR